MHTGMSKYRVAFLIEKTKCKLKGEFSLRKATLYRTILLGTIYAPIYINVVLNNSCTQDDLF